MEPRVRLGLCVWGCIVAGIVLAFLPAGLLAQDVNPVADDSGLQILHFDVGQADAALVMTPDGDVAVIDLGEKDAHGTEIADFLLTEEENGVGELRSLCARDVMPGFGKRG